jgi:hypothetical protein
MRWGYQVAGVGGALAATATAYVLTVRGSMTLDLDIGRTVRPLGPLDVHIAAPPEVVFDVIAAPYLGRTPRAMAGKLRVVERGGDMVLADHFTTTSLGLVAKTRETVRFQRPHRVDFRLVAGPVPHVVESFELRPAGTGTDFAYRGELGADLWELGRWWGERVARSWERAVATSVEGIRVEAERRAHTAQRG